MNDEPLAVLRAVNLKVRDLDAALGFYREGMGLEVIHQIEQIAVLDLGNVRLVLDQQEDPRTTGSGAVLHMWVADLDAFHELLVGRGITPESPPGDRPWGDRDFMVVDPDGYRLTIIQAPPDAIEG